jgi:hypothetical protein
LNYRYKLELKQKYEYLITPEVATVESNREIIPKFSLASTLNRYSGPYSSKIKISFNVINNFPQMGYDSQKFHFYYSNERKAIYYVRPIGFRKTIKLLLKNLLNGTQLLVNGDYYKFVRLRLDNVYPPGVHLADILSVNLLERKYTPLHCAAISSANEGTLLVAPPDTGKTVTTLLALKRGFSYMAEDIAIVDGDNVYANPYTSTFLHNDEFTGYNKINKSLFSLYRKIPFLRDYIRPRGSVRALLKNLKIDQKAPIKNIFIMDKGRTSIEKLDPNEAIRRIMIINRNEFSYYKNPLLFAYSYFNPELNINKLMKVEEDLVQTVVDRAPCFLLKSNEPKQYIELILKSIQR